MHKERTNELIAREILQSCCWCDLANSFISNRYNARASTLLEAINYNVTPPLSNELRYRATIVQSITRILDLLTFRSRTPYTYVYTQNIWKKNSLTTDSPFSISRQRATGTVESAKQTKTKGVVYRSYSFCVALSPLRKFVIPLFSHTLLLALHLPPPLRFLKPNVEMCSRPIARAEGRKWQRLVTQSDGTEASERKADERTRKRRRRKRESGVWRRLRGEDKRCRVIESVALEAPGREGKKNERKPISS